MASFTLRDPLTQEKLKAQEVLLSKKPPADLKSNEKRPRKASKKGAPAAHAVDPLTADFRNFLALIWHHLGLPEPSGVQLSLAWWLQHGPDRAVILGFRGMAKSWITGAFILWNLYCDPQKKILVVSASKERAVQTVQWCLALIRTVPELQHLQPGPLQRQSGSNFDVGPALPDQSPSVRGAGITGQITGSRAHLIVPDDVEIPSNSMTVLMREKISESVKEFDSVLHPGGLVKFLGTPQTDDSLYPKLYKRGYTIRIWPAQYPSKKERIKYGERLSPYILNKVLKDPTLVGRSVWQARFPDEDLAKRRTSLGKSTYALQFLLDTSRSDADRYPLKLQDLIVMDLDLRKGPEMVAWGNANTLILQDLPLMGFDGDRYYAPANDIKVYSDYARIVGALDPSGRGGDETSLAIGAELHGRVFLLYNGAWRDGYGPSTLKAIAEALCFYQCHHLVVEDNFGDGMFIQLLTPYVIKAWKEHNARKPKDEHKGTNIEGIRSSRVQKELRMLSVLEPAVQGHRLVVAKKVIEDDFKSLASIDGDELRDKYSLFHQFTHLTRERDSLLHDDRVEAVALLVSQFSATLGINPWDSVERSAEDKLEEELRRLHGDIDEEGLVAGAKGGRGGRIKAAKGAGGGRRGLH